MSILLYLISSQCSISITPENVRNGALAGNGLITNNYLFKAIIHSHKRRACTLLTCINEFDLKINYMLLLHGKQQRRIRKPVTHLRWNFLR